MTAQQKEDGPASAYTWFVLMQLDQHRERSMGGTALMIKDLAFHKEHSGPGGRQAAAEALAVPLMNLYSALGQAGLDTGVSMDQAKQQILSVLLDGEKTVGDLAAVFDRCYRFPEESLPE